MKTTDARRLSPTAQEALRVRVIAAIEEDKVTPTEAAKIFGVSRQAIYNWVFRKKAGGARGLKSQKRGPKKISRLAPHQAATTVRCITDRCPDQMKLPFALWTREDFRNRYLFSDIQGIMDERKHSAGTHMSALRRTRFPICPHAEGAHAGAPLHIRPGARPDRRATDQRRL